MSTTIAEQLRARRKALGLGQGHVADALGMNRSSISDIERGRRSTHVEDLRRWARSLDAELLLVDGELASLLDNADPVWLAAILRAVPHMTGRERRVWAAEASLIVEEAEAKQAGDK